MRIIFMIQEIARKLTKDNLTGYAAQSCFYIILSIFPCLLLLMSLFKFLPLTEDALLLMLKGVIPVQLEPFLVSIIEDLYDNSSAALTFHYYGCNHLGGRKRLSCNYAGIKYYFTIPKRNETGCYSG